MCSVFREPLPQSNGAKIRYDVKKKCVCVFPLSMPLDSLPVRQIKTHPLLHPPNLAFGDFPKTPLGPPHVPSFYWERAKRIEGSSSEDKTFKRWH